MRTLFLLLMAVAPGVAQDSITLAKLKKAVGRETVMIRLATGEEFYSRLHQVDINLRTLTFGSRRQPRTISCDTISTLAFEPRDRRRFRSRFYSGVAMLSFPVAIALLFETGGAVAAIPWLWPCGYVWGWPLSHAVVKRKTEAFRVDCP